MELLGGKTVETPSSRNVSTRLQQIAGLARQAPKMVFTSLNHHIDVELLTEAYRQVRKDGAVGVDGQTAEEYSVHLEGNLQALLDRFKTGRYKAPPVRRIRIPKDDGTKTRLIGIPTFEDKVLQRAVSLVLEAVYEQDFLECSYGFRRGRSAHQVLQELWRQLTVMRGGWVLEVDIQGFFDTLDHGHLRGFLDQRVRDGVIRRMIDKWLKAGVLESGQLSYPGSGTPQGGVISPLLANIYLHHVLDTWFDDMIRPRLEGEAYQFRYADDVTMLFASERDACRVLAVLPKRLGKHGLALHPKKTRLVDFRRPRGPASSTQEERAGTFDLLGFTHFWGQSQKGTWVVRRKTAKDRFRWAVKMITQWCRRHRHKPIAWQHAQLVRKLRGHCSYYGITGNGRRLHWYRNEMRRAWGRWLRRRSQLRSLTWDEYNRLLIRYPLPVMTIVHSYSCRAANPPL